MKDDACEVLTRFEKFRGWINHAAPRGRSITLSLAWGRRKGVHVKLHLAEGRSNRWAAYKESAEERRPRG